MAEEDDRKGLLDRREAHTRPYTPPNEYDEALFHEKGKSPKEVSYLRNNFEVTCEGVRSIIQCELK